MSARCSNVGGIVNPSAFAVFYCRVSPATATMVTRPKLFRSKEEWDGAVLEEWWQRLLLP